MKTLPLLAAAVLASSIVLSPAVRAETLSVEVSTAGLDINSSHGAATLAHRIEAGVSKACVRANDIRDLKSVATCKDALLSDASEQIVAVAADNG